MLRLCRRFSFGLSCRGRARAASLHRRRRTARVVALRDVARGSGALHSGRRQRTPHRTPGAFAYPLSLNVSLPQRCAHCAAQAREALLRRGQQWALAEPPPPPPPPPPLSEDAADALQDATRALRKQLVGCSDALDAVARLRALAADPRSSPLERQRAADAASEALQAAQTQLLTCYSALRSGTSAVSC